MDTTDTSAAEPPEPDRPSRPGAPSAPGATIDLIDADERLSAEERAWVLEHAARAIGALDATGEVRVRVVGDDEMAREHVTHKGVPGTTDVLTFDLEPERDDTLDADILVCADEARRQATLLGHDAARELTLYIVHGVLHCVGYDDSDEASSAAMHAREDELLELAGVGATFAPARAPSARDGVPES